MSGSHRCSPPCVECEIDGTPLAAHDLGRLAVWNAAARAFETRPPETQTRPPETQTPRQTARQRGRARKDRLAQGPTGLALAGATRPKNTGLTSDRRTSRGRLTDGGPSSHR